MLNPQRSSHSSRNSTTPHEHCQHTRQYRAESGDLIGSWIEVQLESETIISCEYCGIDFEMFFKQSQEEMLRAYHEQQRRLGCPGCGEEPFLG